MAITIEDAVSACMNELRKYYKCEKTVNWIYQKYFFRLIRFYHTKGVVYYDKSVTESFVVEKENKSKSINQIKLLKLHILRLIDFLETGQINFTKKGVKKYNPMKDENIRLLDGILDSYKGYKQRGIIAIIRSFFCYLEEKDVKVSEVTDQTYFDFFEYRKKINPETPDFTKKALIFISTYLNDTKITSTKTDFSKLKIRNPHLAVIKPYTKEEIEKLLSVINEKKRLRDKVFVEIAISMGLRFSDIANLKLENLDWEKQELHITQKKTGTQLSLPMNYTVQNDIAKYILEERPQCNAKEIFVRETAPFTKLTKLPKSFEKYCQIAHIEKISRRSFHSLRRTFASYLSEEHIPLPIISQLLGHKNSDYDRPYLSYDKEKMQFCSLSSQEIPYHFQENLFVGEDLI